MKNETKVNWRNALEYSPNVQYCNANSGGYEAEHTTESVVCETLDSCGMPDLRELQNLEDFRNDDEETADFLLKCAISHWLGKKCEAAIRKRAAADENYKVGAAFLDTCMVGIVLQDNWKQII